MSGILNKPLVIAGFIPQFSFNVAIIATIYVPRIYQGIKAMETKLKLFVKILQALAQVYRQQLPIKIPATYLVPSVGLAAEEAIRKCTLHLFDGSLTTSGQTLWTQ